MDLRDGKHGVVVSENSRSCRVEVAHVRVGSCDGRVDDSVIGGSGSDGFRENSAVVQVGINSRDSGGEILISLVRACQLTRTNLFCPYFA